MKTRMLGKTGLMVSEIGFGGEWLARHDEEEAVELMRYASVQGVNIVDCWMPDPKSRNILGAAMLGQREKWFVQGHLGSTWQNGQYERTRDMRFVKPAFEDLLDRLHTDYIDLGMIHYVDSEKEWDELQDSPFLEYVRQLKTKGIIHHIGMSSHNPKVARKAALSGYIEMILFSINPAFDLLPSSENIDDMFVEEYDQRLRGIDPERSSLYNLCEQLNVGITVMKPFAGGRLFDEKRTPFGVTLTPVQCIHYALSRPAVSSVLCGYDTKEQLDQAVSYENASETEKDYMAVLAEAPRLSFEGSCMYCNHCKPCPKDIDIAMVNKLYDLAVMQEKVPASLKVHYRALEHTADECIGCKSCESRCPFHVSIAERMKKAAGLFC